MRRAVQEYAAQQPALVEAGEQAIALVTSILDEAGINYLSVTGRTKSVPSFAEKAARTLDGQPLYPDPLRDITDQIGVRIITYVHSDVAAVAELLGDQVVVHDDRDLGEETASEGRFGYASRHLLIGLDHGRRASVQIRTVLQHAWAEFEHDIRYKGTVPAEHAPDFDRRFTLAAGLLELADREFSSIREALRPARPRPGRGQRRPAPRPARAGGVPGRAVRRRGLVAHRPLRLDLGLLLELGITSLDELGEVLRPTDDLALNERMDYRYPPGAVRRLDDALLAAFGERYVELHGNEHRVPLLKQRLAKMRRRRRASLRPRYGRLMRAVVCEKTMLEVADVPEPVPAKGQVVLDVVACGICGSDLHARKHSDEMADAAAASRLRPRHAPAPPGRARATSSAARSPTTDPRPAAR